MSLREELIVAVIGRFPVDHFHNIAGHGPAAEFVEVIGISLSGDLEAQLETAERREGIDNRFNSFTFDHRSGIQGENGAFIGRVGGDGKGNVDAVQDYMDSIGAHRKPLGP